MPDDVALEDRIMDEAERRTDDDPVLGGLQHVERFLVGEIAMIDAVDAGAHGALHQFGGARMAGDALAPIMRGAHADRQFLLAERDDFGARVADEFVAGNVEFDIVDALAAAQANRPADFVDAVGDHAEAFGVHVLLALVAEAARRGDLRPGRAIARAGEIAVFDLLAHDDVDPQFGRGRGIAGCEAVIEDERRVAAGAQQMLFGRNFAEILIAVRARRMRDGNGPPPGRASGTGPARR